MRSSKDRSPRGRRFLLSAIGALGIAASVSFAAPAWAEDPVEFGGADIVDTANALSGTETSQVQSAIDELQQKTGTTLLVAYIDTPTSPSDIEDWSNEVVDSNGLGTGNALLVVAVEARQYWFSADSSVELSDTQLQDIESDDIVPYLADDDWAGAAIGAATGIASGLGSSLSGSTGSSTGSGTGSDTGSDGGSGGFNLLPTVLILGGFAALIVIIVVSVSRRRRRTQPDAVAGPSQRDLDLQSGKLLVELDDAVKTSEQELGFAVAEFGEQQTAAFSAALTSARGKLREAFRLKQQLDDAHADTDQQKREWTTQIIALCESADAELDAQTDAFDKLRELGRNAPAALTAVTGDLERTTARIDASEAQLTVLAARYAPSALEPVAQNVAQARKLVGFATAESSRAAASLRSGAAGEAAVAVRNAQQSVAQVGQLLDTVDRTGPDLEAATGKLDDAARELTSDLDESAALTPAAKALTPPELDALVADARKTLAAAGSGGDARRDPVAALTAMVAAEARVDAALAPARENAKRIERARATLERAIAGARSQIDTANDFITTRRGSVGDGARTRLAEAQRHLDQAISLGFNDPEAAIADAQAASSLAVSALNFAKTDVGDFWTSGSGGYGSGSSWSGGSRSNSSSGDDVAGAVLGGIIGGLFSGGGSGGGYRSSGRSSGGFGGFSGGSSSRRSGGGGSFGGGSRSFGGSRSGGGRRGGGGRF
ncbi:TPM domain-containing protein [Naasia lichenicola]|uniref:TPM domain-containing protein n=1 Tax=Naasia lichenicola TaxID=2565933 RepID=UPI00130D6435|nr:TPM domain-containing protein [Naasia lichenicola]